MSELAETVTQLDIEEQGGKRESNRNSNFGRKDATARTVRVFPMPNRGAERAGRPYGRSLFRAATVGPSDVTAAAQAVLLLRSLQPIPQTQTIPVLKVQGFSVKCPGASRDCHVGICEVSLGNVRGVPMAKVRVTIPEVPVGNQDIVFRAHTPRGKVGELHISRGSIDWWPLDAKKAVIRLSWVRFAKVMGDEVSNVTRRTGRSGK